MSDVNINNSPNFLFNVYCRAKNNTSAQSIPPPTLLAKTVKSIMIRRCVKSVFDFSTDRESAQGKRGAFLIDPSQQNSETSASRQPCEDGGDRTRALRKGIILCLISTLMYSFVNIFLRQLGEMEVPHSWTICVKELICIGSLTPVILYWIVRGRYYRPAIKWVLCILVGATFCEYVGARQHLVAFDVVGLVVSVPLIQASTMVFSAVIGLFLLRERISRRCRIAMLVMLTAMGCLLFGPSQPPDPDAVEEVVLTTSSEPIPAETHAPALEPASQQAASSTPQTVTGYALLFGGLGAVAAGLGYSVHVVCLRMAGSSRQMPITLIAVQVTGVGAAIFGFEFLRDNDWHVSAFWREIPTEAWPLILMTGLFNTVGFLLQITGLRYTVVARAQMIAVAQIVVGTLFGVFAYREATNVMIWLGVLLTVTGIYIVSTPDRKELSQG